MSSSTFGRISWFGVALVLAGGILLFDKLEIIHIHFHDIIWPLVMLFGLVRVMQGFSRARQAGVFFGTVLFLSGLFFLLRSLDQFDLRGFVIVPAAFLIVGIGFLMMYFNNLREWFYLIPALLFGLVGAAFFMSEWGYLYRWEVWERVRLFWPVALILLGVAIIFKRRSRRQPAGFTGEPVVAPPPPGA